MNSIEKSSVVHLFGRRIRHYRKQANLSQIDLAYACAVDRAYIGRIERGEASITLPNIYRIAAGLGINVNKLFEEINTCE